MTSTQNTKADRIAGMMIAFGPVLALLMVSHHPVVRVASPTQVVSGISAVSSANQIVHGIVIFALTLLGAGLLQLSFRLGMRRISVSTAFVTYMIGLAAIVGAATTDGFVTTGIAAHCAAMAGGCNPSILDVLLFCSVLIQALTKIAMVTMSAAILLWSITLIKVPSLPRLCGMLGVIVGVGTVIPVAIAGIRFTPHSLLFLLGGQALWYVFAAVLVSRGDLRAEGV